VRFVVEKVTLGQVSLQVLEFFCTIIIPSVYHIQLHEHVGLSRKQMLRQVTLKKKCSFRIWGAVDRKILSLFIGFSLQRVNKN
jgi:hypothetical protein